MSVHGLLLIRKPEGITSHDVVKKIKNILKISSVGHAGTLDPMATGLMVLLLGEGTKLSDYILNGDKTYHLKVQLGITTDSLDITGKVLTQQTVSLDPDEIVYQANRLQGEFVWPAPIFSAVKINGQKLYSYAHQNKEPDQIPMKPMSFWGLNTISAGVDFFEGEISCSKGSFIRSWAHKLGEVLGVGGTLASLTRTVSHPYSLADAVTIEQLSDDRLLSSNEVRRALVSIETALKHWPAYTVTGRDEKLLNNGQISYDLERRLIVEVRSAIALNKPVSIRVLRADSDKIIGILQAVPNEGLKIKRVFKMT